MQITILLAIVYIGVNNPIALKPPQEQKVKMMMSRQRIVLLSSLPQLMTVGNLGNYRAMACSQDKEEVLPMIRSSDDRLLQLLRRASNVMACLADGHRQDRSKAMMLTIHRRSREAQSLGLTWDTMMLW